MAITLVSSVSAALGVSGGTTGAFDSTGATLLVVGVGASAATTVTDSKGNSYTALTAYPNGSVTQQLFYKLTPVVGTGHTVTVTGGFVAVVAYAFAGVGAYDGQQNGAAVEATGSVTPSVDGALLVTGMVSNQATADTVPAGFTGPVTVPFGAGNNYQESGAYRVQTTAAPINPTWTVAPAKLLATAVAVFAPSGGGGARQDPLGWLL